MRLKVIGGAILGSPKYFGIFIPIKGNYLLLCSSFQFDENERRGCHSKFRSLRAFCNAATAFAYSSLTSAPAWH